MIANAKSMLICIFLSLAFYFGVQVFWGYFPDINPLWQWLLACCAASAWLRPVIFLQDSLVNIVLCIPPAVFLLSRYRDKLWFFTLVWLTAGFLYGYQHLLFSTESRIPLADWGPFLPGLAVQLLSLPVAILLLRWRGARFRRIGTVR